ncbi:MAG: MFS transporter [Chloroflexi bacterium]|nr:MFS transporter [Chloroflexota bacterium]
MMQANSTGPGAFAVADAAIIDPGAWRGILARYLMVATLARLADGGIRVALVLLALSRTSDAAFGGVLVASLLVPHVVAAPIIGAIADRVHNPRLLHAVALTTFAGVLALCGLLVGQVHAVVVLCVTAVGGCLGPLITGGLTSLLGDLMPDEHRERAYGLDMATYNVAGIAGPALAAVLAEAAGPGVAVVALATSAGLSAALLGTLPLRPRDAVNDRPRPSIMRGIGVLWGNRTLRAATIASSVGHVGVGALPLVATLLGAEYAAPAMAGALVSAGAIGGLVGSLGYVHRPIGADKPARVVMGCLLASAVPLALASVVPGLVPSLVLFGVAGVFSGPLGSSLFLVREQQSPSDVRAQVFAIGGGLKYAASALGAAMAGIGAGLGNTQLLMIVAGCHVLGAAIGVLLLGWEDTVGQRKTRWTPSTYP